MQFLAAIGLLFAACDKDVQPSKTSMLISSNWELVSVNGDNDLEGFDLTLTFESDFDYTEVVIEDGLTFTFKGEWKWQNNETEIEVEYDDGDELNADVESISKDKLVLEIDGDEFEFEH
jgi:hypothetical protein